MTNFKKINRTSLLTQKKMIWTFYCLIFSSLFINIQGHQIMDGEGPNDENYAPALDPNISEMLFNRNKSGINLLNLYVKFINNNNSIIEISGKDVLNFDENVKFFVTNSQTDCYNNNEQIVRIISRISMSIILSLSNNNHISNNNIYLCYQNANTIPIHLGIVNNNDSVFR